MRAPQPQGVVTGIGASLASGIGDERPTIIDGFVLLYSRFIRRIDALVEWSLCRARIVDNARLHREAS